MQIYALTLKKSASAKFYVKFVVGKLAVESVREIDRRKIFCAFGNKICAIGGQIVAGAGVYFMYGKIKALSLSVAEGEA